MSLDRTTSLIYALPPFPTAPGSEGAPWQVSVLADPGSRAGLPLANAFRIRRQMLPWQLPDTTLTNLDLLLSPAIDFADGGLYVHGTNYPEIALFSSSNGSTWERAEPNTLANSHRLRNPSTLPGVPGGGWVGTSATVSATTVTGPRAEVPAQQVVVGSGGLIRQDVAFLTTAAGRPFIFGVWLRTAYGTAAASLDLGTTSGSETRNITITDQWQLFLISTASLVGAGTTARVIVSNTSGASATWFFGGAFLTPDTQNTPLFDYETRSAGLLIPVHPETGRRKAFIHLPSVTNAYLRYRIPAAQTTDDGRGYYSTATLAVIPTAKNMGGLHIYPKTSGENQTVDDIVLDGLARVTTPRSALQSYLQLRGTYDGTRSHDDLIALPYYARTQQVLIVENTVRPGGLAADPSQAHLMQLAADRSPRQYPIPHLMAVDMDLVEAW